MLHVHPKQQKIELEKLHKDICEKVQSYLTILSCLIPRKNPLFKQFSNRLLVYLQQSYFTPQPHKDQLQSQEQAKIFSSILNLIKNKQFILHQTDKGNSCYLGTAVDSEEKVQKYFTDTDAFKGTPPPSFFVKLFEKNFFLFICVVDRPCVGISISV